jgi:2-succinyl-5-enolpyruvyl-6-hydroxy-3-cyclohexene-1-carboxylate synthase
MALEGDVYRDHIATPTGLDFEQAAALYGLSHERADSVSALRGALERALSQAQSAIVEVKGERNANVELHRRVWQAVAEAVKR